MSLTTIPCSLFKECCSAQYFEIRSPYKVKGVGSYGAGGRGAEGRGGGAVVFCGYLYYTLFQIALHSVSVHTTVRRKAWLRVW